MKKEPKREEIKQEDKWDLESMYPTIEDWDKDYEKVQIIEEELLKYKGHLLDDAKTLYNYLKDSDELDVILENLIIYANMKSDEELQREAKASRFVLRGGEKEYGFTGKQFPDFTIDR